VKQIKNIPAFIFGLLIFIGNTIWNQVKITVYKGTVIHEMNGVNVLEYHLWTDDWKDMVANSKFAGWEDIIDVAQTGFIGLQDHGDDVWYRNIKIKEL